MYYEERAGVRETVETAALFAPSPGTPWVSSSIKGEGVEIRVTGVVFDTTYSRAALPKEGTSDNGRRIDERRGIAALRHRHGKIVRSMAEVLGRPR